MSVLSAGGVTPVKGTQDQLLQSLYKLLQVQKATAFSAAGTATVLTLAPSPAISAYATNQRWTVKFPVNSGLNPTLNVSAKGAKNLKQYDATGAKVSALFVADQVSDVFYDGVDLVLMDQLPASGQSISGAQGAFTNLKASANGSSAQILISTDEILLESAAGTYLTVRNLSASMSVAASGPSGLDTGSLAASTWYSTWVISNGSTVATLLSLSATSPTLPSGYTHKARIGWVRTDSTANKFPLPFVQHGRTIAYNPVAGSNLVAYPTMSSGVVAFPTPVAWATFAPPTAARLSIQTLHAQGGIVWLSPSPNTNFYYTSAPSGVTTTAVSQISVVGASLYWGSNSGSTGTPSISMYGWEDNL